MVWKCPVQLYKNYRIFRHIWTKDIANIPQSILVLYNRTLLTVVRSVSNCILNTQVHNNLQVPKLEIS
jgi:hypothetical protein